MTDPSSNVVDSAEFRERANCIACRSAQLEELDRGLFGAEPHRSWILESPWGESPFPYLENCEWVLVRCHACQQVFHKRVLTDAWEERRFRDWMTQSAIRRFEESAGRTTARWRFERARADVGHLLKLERTTRALRRDEPLRILDFGCGWGRFVGIARSFGCDADGIDRSAARRAGHEGETYIHESLEAYRATGKPAVHALTLFQVLEHIFDPIGLLEALRELVVPGGVLILEVPNAAGVTHIRSPNDIDAIDGIDHINAFSPDTLGRIAACAGFSPFKPSVAQVTADFPSVIKREVHRVVDLIRRPTTDRYFRRAP